MKKDGKYRYSLQFDDSTEERRLVGEFLEQLGNKKSTIIVEAMLQYLETHSEALKDEKKIEILIRSTPEWSEIENKIRSIISEGISSVQAGNGLEQTATGVIKDISTDTDTDIDEMLLNLDLFDQ